jgi:hypothetical protein
MTKHASLATTLLVLVFCGCSAVPKQRFSHRFHRLQYRLTDEEIKGLQFYISSDVLAQTTSPTDRAPTGTSVILLPKDTPGVATEVGPDWIRVTFRKGGKGVPFLADTASNTDAYLLYALATPAEGTNEGTKAFRTVADSPENVAVYDGISYTVVEGYNAILMVDADQLQALIDKRKIGAGVEIK